MATNVEKTTSTAATIPTEHPSAVTDPACLPSAAAQLREALISQVSTHRAGSSLEELFAQHPHILDASDFSCDEEDLAVLEEALV